MARALIVGCGCSGRALGAELLVRGWQVRGTSRRRERAEEIDSAGLEAAIADPARPGTVLDLVGDVAVIVWLLGSARGEPQDLAAIHGERLEALLERLVDTPVRGFAYEAVGTAGEGPLRRGREALERASATWRIPAATLEAPRSEPGWAGSTADAVAGALARP